MASTILIVEDDLDCRTVLADLLELSGYAVAAFGDAALALEAARRSPPDLAMVDLNLPGRDGAWLVQALREGGAPLSTMPVVLTTGSADARGVARSLGVHPLEKPFDAGHLLDLLDTLLRARAALPR